MISVQKLLEIVEERRGYQEVEIVPDGYAEPGYNQGKPVVLGNWNNKTRYDPQTGTRVDVDNTMERLARIFERMGWEVDWEDEYAMCGTCWRAVRVVPDSYGWRAYYFLDSEWSEITCGDCVKENPERYLEVLDGNSKQAMTIDIDLTQHGYVLERDGYETGLRSGQNDDPEKIAAALRARGVRHFIFVLDYQGQFGVEYSVWVKE